MCVRERETETKTETEEQREKGWLRQMTKKVEEKLRKIGGNTLKAI